MAGDARRARRLYLAILVAGALLAASLAAPARAAALSFSTPLQLPFGNPAQHPYYQGGEPGITFDPSGDGHVYIDSPQGIPSLLNVVTAGSDATQGVVVWASSDHGASWPVTTTTGSLLGGGDSDVEVLPDHSVLVADLEAVASALCTSHDFAVTFPDCQGGLVPNQQGPDNDRPWLTRGPQPNEVYLTYHDFVAGYPLIERSTDGGRTFSLCGNVIDPLGPAIATYSPLAGATVAAPVVAPDDTIYVEFSTPSALALPTAPADHLYMAVARGGCSGSTTFKNYVVYQSPGADLANAFQEVAMDGGGALYVVAAGKIHANQSGSGMYLWVSHDGGSSWTSPTEVSSSTTKAVAFPTVAGGEGAGEAVLGWFGTSTSGDAGNPQDQWRFFAAETYDAGHTFSTATVTPNVIHYGDICTEGLFCGLVPGQPGNRNLADFASAAVDPASGCAAFAIPGDPYNRPDLSNGPDTGGSSAYFARQLDGSTCLTPANAGLAASAVGASGAQGNAVCSRGALPSATVTHRSARAGRLRLSGRASARGCAPGGRARVKRVEVALARRAGSRCRFVGRRGRLSSARSCNRRIYLRAVGTAQWRFRPAHRLAPGRYLVWVRAIDSARAVGRAHRISFIVH